MRISRLRAKEKCPIHKSYFCCGREARRKKAFGLISGPVERVEDPFHPRGYREICSKAELRRRLHLKIAEQGARCADPKMGGCGLVFVNMREVELDHIEPKGMGSARRDDHIDNLQALHKRCNFAKGSKRIA